MEEDGIYYFFEHSADKHVLVMADHPGAHPADPGYTRAVVQPAGRHGRRP
jgi:uncharacterized protein involved in type VI secretion and phage assembly